MILGKKYQNCQVFYADKDEGLKEGWYYMLWSQAEGPFPSRELAEDSMNWVLEEEWFHGGS